jgi:o-succinylbenzoate synthase
MLIESVRWQAYRLPMRNQFTTAHEAINWRTGAIVEILTSQGVSGFGEVAPLPSFGVGTMKEAEHVLKTISPSLVGQTLPSALIHLQSQADQTNQGNREEQKMFSPPAFCGLEIALLDALGKQEQRSLSSLLSPGNTPPRKQVAINIVVGATRPEDAVQAALKAIEAGFTCIKLKVGIMGSNQAEIERIKAVRSAIGPSIQLRLDANEGWEPEQAYTILTACEPLTIQYIEQPIKAGLLDEMRNLRQRVSIPIACDEGLLGLASARQILQSQAADLLIIKPQFAGGLLAARQIITEATEQGVGCVITSAIEAGIGLVADLHLAAASPEITLACGLGTLPLLADDLLVEDLASQAGYLSVPTGPGLGVNLNHEALAIYRAP